MKLPRRAFLHLAAGAAVPFAPWISGAQPYPTQPVRIIVGFGPGGSDRIARAIAPALSSLLQQRVLIENMPGALGATAADFVSRSAADGHTALMLSNANALLAVMNSRLAFDPVSDFQMISMIGLAGRLLAASPSFPAGSLKETFSLIRDNPEKYSYGSPGPGTTQQFSMEMMLQKAQLKLRHIPYPNSSAALDALRTGQIDFLFELIETLQKDVRSGAVQAIAVTSGQRFPTVDNVPTFAEAGMGEYDVTSWYALAFPARTPLQIVACANTAMKTLLETEDARNRLLKLGTLARWSTPEEIRMHMESEIANWKKVRDNAGIVVN